MNEQMFFFASATVGGPLKRLYTNIYTVPSIINVDLCNKECSNEL